MHSFFSTGQFQVFIASGIDVSLSSYAHLHLRRDNGDACVEHGAPSITPFCAINRVWNACALLRDRCMKVVMLAHGYSCRCAFSVSCLLRDCKGYIYVSAANAVDEVVHPAHKNLLYGC